MTSQIATLIYPHQLYEFHPGLNRKHHIILVQDPLYFTQYKFHTQKVMLHLNSMRYYRSWLVAQGYTVSTVESNRLKKSGDIANVLHEMSICQVYCCDLNDDWLDRRVKSALSSANIKLTVLDDPGFLTPQVTVDQYTATKSKYRFIDFYIQQRRRTGILIENGKPQGGKWTYDTDNRKKLPKGTIVPRTAQLNTPSDIGSHLYTLGAKSNLLYPSTHAEAKVWLNDFVDERLALFGDYEDSISASERILYHSVLTPMLNIGLITPQQIIDTVLLQKDRFPLNSLEGFIRQVIGWREFVRIVYRHSGKRQRKTNFFDFQESMPGCLYTGSTGIIPVDHVIRNILQTGYCHHIERLMILGNFMLLCRINPDAVYQWFMELFVDAYDWVMVPNVYGMSQYADGGLMTTKPYISGSAYIQKMSDYPKGEWCAVWDALYWIWIDDYGDRFISNPRMAMILQLKKKLGSKLKSHRKVADDYLNKLYHL